MREYGLMIERRNHYGSEYVHAIVCRREAGKDQALGCTGEGESEFDKDVPKHMHGLMLDGLGMYGFITEYNDNAYIAFMPEYRDVFAMDLPKLGRMNKTLKRVLARISKARAHEAGDVFQAFADSLKLSFVIERKGDRPHSEWVHWSVAEGRNRFRMLIGQAQADHQKRHGIKVAS